MLHQVEIAEEEGGGTDLRALPPRFAYFDAKVSQVEALYFNRQYRKASIYGFHTLEWMARCRERGVEVLLPATWSNFVNQRKLIFIFHAGVLRNLLPGAVRPPSDVGFRVRGEAGRLHPRHHAFVEGHRDAQYAQHHGHVGKVALPKQTDDF